MAMVFCRGCGKEIYESAPSCPHCGAPQAVAAQAAAVDNTAELASLSDGWKARFALIEQAGGVKLPNAKSLSFWDLCKVTFNWMGFLFGPIYYFVKGMWKKGLSLLGVGILISIVLEVIANVIGTPWLGNAANIATACLFANRANIDFYKKLKLNDNGWW